MNELTKDELIEIYNGLYLREDSIEGLIDYASIVKSYRGYLGLFFNEESSFYDDFEFLFYVVDGFSCLHQQFFGEEEVSYERIKAVLYEHDSEIRRKNQMSEEESVEYTDSDIILVYSLQLAMLFSNRNMLSSNSELIHNVLLNSYVIREETTKGKKKQNSDGAVYWKNCH